MQNIWPGFQLKIKLGIQNKMGKTIGILGGMGPHATIDLFNKIVCNTPSKVDQDHHSIIIYNNPKIPPRMYAFDKGAESPLQELIRSAIVLESAGADFIIMSCNTAHIWLDELKRNINIPFYSMIENTVEHLLKLKASRIEKMLLFATESTIQAHLYQNALVNSSYRIVVPKVDEQQLVNRAIKDVKTGKISTNNYINDLNLIIQKYKSNGISIAVGGCTEIPLLFPYIDTDIMMIDPTLLLAKMAINKAMI